MKTYFKMIMGCLCVCLMASCSTTKPTTNEQKEEDTAPVTSDHALVVYFSLPETSNPENMNQEEENSSVIIDGEVLGNTQYIATQIQEYTNADSFRIEAKTAYPLEHSELIDQAKDEQTQNTRPEINNQIENFDQYDTIFVGYPNWWGDMPMILYSFFDQYDFTNKTIIPFNTHGGSGLSNTIETMQALEPNANVNTNGFSVSRDVVIDAKADVTNWLRDLGF